MTCFVYFYIQQQFHFDRIQWWSKFHFTFRSRAPYVGRPLRHSDRGGSGFDFGMVYTPVITLGSMGMSVGGIQFCRRLLFILFLFFLTIQALSCLWLSGRQDIFFYLFLFFFCLNVCSLKIHQNRLQIKVRQSSNVRETNVDDGKTGSNVARDYVAVYVSTSARRRFLSTDFVQRRRQRGNEKAPPPNSSGLVWKCI